MQIAIIHHQLKLKGGMETYLLNLIQGFNQAEDQVTVFFYKKKKINSYPFCKIKRKNLSWLPRPLRRFWFASNLHHLKDLHNCHLKISLMRVFYQDITVCGGTHLGYLNYTGKKSSLIDKLEIAYEKKSYLTSTFIVTHSKQLKDELIQLYGIPEKKILTCYPPINTDLFNQCYRPEKQRYRTSYQIDASKTAILFPSTGHKRKGFSALIEAMKLLPSDQYELIVAGSQPQQTNLPNVKYVGFIQDMATLYTACDLTILPSYYEPFGLVVIESLECGTPVIISNQVGAKDLITENEGMILENLSPEVIASTIKTASNFRFNIEPNFAKRKGLTIEAHIARLKQLSNKFNQKEIGN